MGWLKTAAGSAKAQAHSLLAIAAWVLGCAGPMLAPGAALAEEPPHDPYYRITGDIDGQYSYNKSEYVSRRVTLAADLAYPMPARELDGELRFDREYIKEDQNSGPNVNRDKYDASLKYKSFFDESPYYAFVSPRTRHNRFGYYQTAHSLRIGLGRRFGEGSTWAINLELGSGYRVAHAESGENVSEVLYITTVKANWDINDRLSLKFNGVQEQSARETFRTMSLALRNTLTRHIGLKYEVLYRRSFPFDSQQKDGEIAAEFGVSYTF